MSRWLRQLGDGDEPLTLRRCELDRLLRFVEAHLHELNGRPWRAELQPAAQLQLVTDPSDSAIGAHAGQH